MVGLAMRRSVYHAVKVITRYLWLRFHITLILGAIVLVGVATNWLAWRLGLHRMAIRYGVGVLAGYAAFFVGVKLWLAYAQSALSPKLQAEIARLDADPRPPAPLPPSPREGSWLDGLDFGFSHVGDADGCLVAIIAAFVFAAILGLGAYVLGEAPLILGEAFVQVSLAAALRSRVRKLDQPDHWSGAVLRATWVQALVVLVLAMLTGWLLQRHCPTATRLVDALWHCPR